MSRQLYDIWHEEGPHTDFQWRAQMFDYIAQFPTKEASERYVAAVKEHRSAHYIEERK